MYNEKYPMLSEKGILGATDIVVFAPIVVFLMDRIISSGNIAVYDGSSWKPDKELTNEESIMFDQLTIEYGHLFSSPVGTGSSTFFMESERIGKIYGNFIHASEDARMTWEAVEFVGNEFNDEQKIAMVDILERLATCDKYLDNKELAIFYAVVMACHSEIESVNKIFTQLYERIVKIHTSDHQMAKALMILMNFISENPKSVKISVLGRPDPRTEGNIPPVLFTDEEFADWINIVTLMRASQNRGALMIQSRVYWRIGENEDGRILTSEKGLIKFFHISSSEDDQINESLDFTRAWCKAIRDGVGNIKMVDETIFQVVVFGEAGKMSIAPDFSIEGLWKITCKKISSGIELHAFDITGDDKTYWCPELAEELVQKVPLEIDWVNGNFPVLQNSIDEEIIKIGGLFNNEP